MRTREEKRREEPPKPPKGFNAIASLLLLLCLDDWKSLTLILRPEWGPACGVEGLQLSTGVAGGQVHTALCAGGGLRPPVFRVFECERLGGRYE